MSEETKLAAVPEVAPETPKQELTAEPEVKDELNLAGKSLAELSDLFKELMESDDRMSRGKEAEAIKSAFYRLLLKLKSESEEDFTVVEENFKGIYAEYKRQRTEYTKAQEAMKEENLEKKKAIVEELKALVEGQEDVSAQFPAFRELQDRWRAVGPVPATAFRDLNSSYQFQVEKFYDMVKINRDLRDLDFKKNYEAKLHFCEEAEKLAAEDNIIAAFGELQKLHEQWKELGPVAKEHRETIWARFQAATATINKRYQAHFEDLKEKQKENLAAKTALCEKVEEIAAKEVASMQEWNALAKQIEEIQAEWRKIGFATKKENQHVYERFRAACNAFFARRREVFTDYRSRSDENLAKKLDIIKRAEELKSSTDWKATTEAFVKLQQEWKEVGPVSRKRSEQLWKDFRAACDEFFAARENFYKSRPRKEHGLAPRQGSARPARNPKEELIKKYNALQQEIETMENNMGFFSASKNAEGYIAQLQANIDKARQELAGLKEKIRKEEEGEQ
ncbi:MAG: DUF349 domain-containing protein [Bacteroidales bacterium]|nr:DUF349 domain-containing protein [Bacteroidales bacterium]